MKWKMVIDLRKLPLETEIAPSTDMFTALERRRPTFRYRNVRE